MMKLNKTNFLFFILHIYVQYLQDLYDESHYSKNMPCVRDVQYNTGHYRPEVRSLEELRAKKEWTKTTCRNFLKFCKKRPPNCKMKSCSQCCSIKENKNLFLRPLRRNHQYLSVDPMDNGAVIRAQRHDLQMLQASNPTIPIRIKIPERFCPLSQFIDRFLDLINAIKSCSHISEQNFLYNLWTMCEIIQDSIYDQDSDTYKLLEVINPMIFETWLRTGRRGNDPQF